VKSRRIKSRVYPQFLSRDDLTAQNYCQTSQFIITNKQQLRLFYLYKINIKSAKGLVNFCVSQSVSIGAVDLKTFSFHQRPQLAIDFPLFHRRAIKVASAWVLL